MYVFPRFSAAGRIISPTPIIWTVLGQYDAGERLGVVTGSSGDTQSTVATVL